MAQEIYKSAAGRDQVMALYDRVLAEWPVPCAHLHLQTRHGDTFVVASDAREARAMACEVTAFLDHPTADSVPMH